MKPIHRVLAATVLGPAIIVVGFMTISAVKHVKGKDGYIIPTDGTPVDPSQIEIDHLANFMGRIPFYSCLLVGILILGYGVITVLRSVRRDRQQV